MCACARPGGSVTVAVARRRPLLPALKCHALKLFPSNPCPPGPRVLGRVELAGFLHPQSKPCLG